MLEYYIEIGARWDPAVDPGPALWKADRDQSTLERIYPYRGQTGSIAPTIAETISLNENVPDVIRRISSPPATSAIERLFCPPGEFYPRIARPVLGSGDNAMIAEWSDHEMKVRAPVGGQLDWLIGGLYRISQTAHPDPRNLSVYGHEIRNLLILACTEVEAGCRGVLIANGYTPTGRFSTADYVRVRGVLRLDEYAISYSAYPQLAPIKPFEGWDAKRPTESLGWYDAYNATKHDRERAFEKSTLDAALRAVSACAILMYAQFGSWAGSREGQYIALPERPKWSQGDCYVPPGFVGQSQWVQSAFYC